MSNSTTADRLHQLIAKWREGAIQAGRLVNECDARADGANAHAFLKERRIWTTCADELSALLAAPLPRPAIADRKEESYRQAIEYIKRCVSQQPLPRDLAVQAAVSSLYRYLDILAAPLLQPAQCVIGEYCSEHQFIHGAEAEELRERLEELANDDRRNCKRSAIRRILDDVDARDSCAFREAKPTSPALPQPEGWQPAEQKFMIRTTPHLCPHCHKSTGGTAISTMASGAGPGFPVTSGGIVTFTRASGDLESVPLPPAPLVTDKEHP